MTTEALDRTAPPSVPASDLQWTVIEPTNAWAALRLGEVWRARELILFLIWRDIKVRYKQTAIGAGWAVIQPLITVLIFSLLLGKYAHIKTGGIPYPIFIFGGLLPWIYFAYSITQTGKSLVDNERLVTKLYFPRLALPIATTFTGIPDFLVGCGVFAVMMPIFGIGPSWRILAVPLFLLMAIGTAFGVGLWLSALNVAYRDVKYVLPFLTQIWMFASPVVYPGHVFKDKLVSALYALNPMVGVINGFRWALLGKAAPTVGDLAPSISVMVFLIVTGLFYFKHMDKTSADII
ncbi:MAG TPA: ABC transporter permease [Chloroflexota bacterium]|jgi:lipopolysaccharide transport system permease protein|nr:ABC transporter permease [Chloroflexota bacterium]